MNSKERRDARYIRRVTKRIIKKEEKYSNADDYNEVFSFSHLFKSYQLSCRNVGWKGSVQSYKANALMNLYKTYIQLREGKFKSAGFYEFDIRERGKLRHIRSVNIMERVVQRCLCDYCLVPLMSRSFIYDNAASQKGKGITFSLQRMKTHLRRFYNQYGNDGYILQYDFSKYFDSLPHSKIYEVIDKYVKDERLNSLTKYFVDVFGEKGLGLGSQVSQILSLACANDIDHKMKEVMRAKYYGRYMDDGYIISHDKEYLHKCLEELKSMCEKSGIQLNLRKTQIKKLSKGFVFLKVKFFLLDSGKIVSKIAKSSVVRMRRKLKKFKNKVDKGEMRFEDVVCSMQSWIGHTIRLNAYRSRMGVISLYQKLFKEYIKGGQGCLKY